MKDFANSRLGRAIFAALTVTIIWAICTPIFDILFHGGIKEFDVFEFVVEPILVGLGVGILEYIFQISNRRKNRK